MLKNGYNLNDKIMTLPDQMLIFIARVGKVVVDMYTRFQLSIKPISKDIHSSIGKYEESVSHRVFAINSLL